MFVANFLGGPERSNYKEPINVKITLIDYLLYYVMGSLSLIHI